MLKLDALQKYENALLENFSPSVLRELKRSNWNGLLREVDRLYATMYHEWDALQKDVVDIEDAVKSLNWTVMPYTRDGEEPGELAREVAQVVQDALWARSQHDVGSIGHTFQQLLGALVHHRFRGYNVHQIVWKRAGDLVFPARYIQLPPQFMVWETKAGHPDRLLLVEDGMSADGVPFPQHKYIVALNHSGPDHPLYNATFYSLVNWFVAFKFGLGWFMEYAQKYGMPKQIIRYANEKDRQQIVDDLTDETVLNTVILKEGQGSGFEVQYPTGGAASLPQAVLLQKAEEACHKAILGQTLTSDTSQNGGSLAQAKVHAGVQADVVMKIAESVADILNQQLIPAIVQANYGRVQGLPIPELRCKLPQAVASIERAQFLKTALEIPGMKVVKSEVYEYLNLTQPGDDDEVFEAKDPNQQPPGGGFGGGFGGFGGEDEQQPGMPDMQDERDEVVASARAEARKNDDPARAWLAPLKKKLEEARAAGASLSEIKTQMRSWLPDTRALASAMAENIKAGFARGAAAKPGPAKGNATEEVVQAVKGCNQHEHQPGCEDYDGVSNIIGKTEKHGEEWEELLDSYKNELEKAREGATKIAVKTAEKAIKDLEWQMEYVTQDLRWYKQVKGGAYEKSALNSMSKHIAAHADKIAEFKNKMEEAFAKLRGGRRGGKKAPVSIPQSSSEKTKDEPKATETQSPRTDAAKKDVPGETGSFEERFAKAREAKTPEDFIKAMGLDMENEASEESIGEFLRAMKNRHPENLKHMGRLFKWGPHEWTQKEKNKISKVYEEILPMLSPEVVRNLTPVNVAIRRMKPNEGGEYSNGKIFYNIRASKESHVHEFFHHVHDSASDAVYDKISDYYRLRIKGNVVQTLFDGVKGFADNFATSVDANTIYAGAVYTNKKGEIERTDRRVTGDIFGPKRNRTDGLNGSEFVTAHLEKLACSKSKFTKLWNDKRNGKYYWREGFIESMRVMFNK